MNNKTIILIIALLTCVGSVYSQGTSPALADTEGKYKYNYVPVSPVSEELMKHIMCPVNYNTGKVELSIPIYEIRTRDFTLPLRLQYDSGGIKVSAGNGVAGLGWNVDFGATTMGTSPCPGLRSLEEGSYAGNGHPCGTCASASISSAQSGFSVSMPIFWANRSLSDRM